MDQNQLNKRNIGLPDHVDQGGGELLSSTVDLPASQHKSRKLYYIKSLYLLAFRNWWIMKNYTHQWLDDNTLKISGRMDEHFQCDFPDSLNPNVNRMEVFSKPGNIWLDLSGVDKINSCGAKTWYLWIETVTPTIHYVNCSPAIIGLFNMISNRMGKSAVVESFQAVYRCESENCEKEDVVLLTVGKDIITASDSVEIQAPSFACPACGAQTFQLDGFPEEYFQFLAEIHKREVGSPTI